MLLLTKGTETTTVESLIEKYHIEWNLQSGEPFLKVEVDYTDKSKKRSMTDTILNGSGNYQQYQANANDYRAQEFPNGSVVTAQTHTLKILRS